MLQKNRVLVTSMSMATPLGISAGESFEAMLAGRSGIKSLADDPRYEGRRCQVGGKLHPSYYEKGIHKSFATKFGSGRENVYTLANFLVSQAIFNDGVLSHYLKRN